MNFRLTALLFGTVFVAALVLLGLALTNTDTPEAGDLLLAELGGAKAEQISAVEIEKGGEKLVLTRAGKDRWAVAEPVAARADSTAATAVVNALLQARPTTYPELSANPAVHGLDKPLQVTLREEGGKSSTLNVGDVTIGGSKAVAFVSTPARPRPMAVPRSAVDALLRDSARTSGHTADLAKWVNDYRTKGVFAVDSRGTGDDVAALKLTAKGKELALTRAGGGWKFDAPAGWGDASAGGDASATTPGGIAGVRGLLNTVTNLQAGGSDDFLPDPADSKEYGLDPANPDLIRVQLTPKDGPPEVVLIGKKVAATPPAAPPLPGTPPPAGKVYVKIEGTPGVIRATAPPTLDALAAVVADPTPLRDRDLLPEDARARIDAIDVTAGGQAVKLRKTGDWKLYGGPTDPQPAYAVAVNNLIGLLTQPRVVKDFPAANDAHFAGTELKAEVKVWADGVEAATDPKAEPKLKGTPTTFQFGKRDATGVFVRRILPTGAKADFVIPDRIKVGTDAAETDAVAAATKTRLAYLDPALAKFSPLLASRFTVSHGAAATLDLLHDKTADPPHYAGGKWKFVKPDAQKDRVADTGAVNDLLTLLSTQQAGTFVSEQPADADLVKWGLTAAAPRAKVVVGLDPAGATDADKQRVFTLGNDAERDATQVYARQDGRAAVFLVPRFLFDRLTTADLREKTVVRFDRTKVRDIRLRGWRQATGVPTLFEFEKKGNDWVAKTPAGFPVDSAKVNAFLDLLDGLRAKAFLPGPVKPEHRFPPEDEGLEVTVYVEGVPPISLNLAAATDNGASYFLHVGSLPENERVVTVAADPFKPFKERPAAFAK